jgi:hypothetical protein
LSVSAGPLKEGPSEALCFNKDTGTMTKKHFIALARRIAAINDASARLHAAQAVADVAALDNPRFDRARFMAACGVSL